MQDNGFGRGLPPASKNGGFYRFKAPLLADPTLKPGPAIMQRCAALFRALLRVRYSSPLFRLPNAAAVIGQLQFHNTGPQQTPGVIVMELYSSQSDNNGVYDPLYKRVVVVFNALPVPAQTPYPPYAQRLVLHPVLAEAAGGVDPELAKCEARDGERQLVVPVRTVAVFVEPR